MDALTRRKFLITSGVVGGRRAGRRGGPRSRSRHPGHRRQPGPGARRPHARGDHPVRRQRRPGHRRSRSPTRPTTTPGRACPTRPNRCCSLDDTTGLNPSFKGFKKLYDAKQLAVIRGVGYPKPDRSHFRSMDIWQTANPTRPGNTGWLGRWLDNHGGDPRLAVSFEPVLPPLLAGAKSAGASVPVTEGKAARPVNQAGAGRARQAVAGRTAAAGPGGRLLRRPAQGRRADRRGEGRGRGRPGQRRRRPRRPAPAAPRPRSPPSSTWSPSASRPA